MFAELLDETGRFMAETLDRMLGDLCTPAVLKAADGGNWSADLWDAVAKAGFARATLGEAQGGAELTLPEALPLAAVAARHAAPLPLAEGLVAGALLAATNLAVPEGVLTIAAGAGAVLGADGRLTGTLASVPWAAQANALVLVACAVEGPRLCLLTRDQWQIAAARNLANEPRETIAFDLELAADRIAPAPSAEALLNAAALARSVQIAGALTRVRDMTVQYAQEREQFGRPLGKFQAIQQTVSVLASDVAVAEAAAAVALGNPADPLAVAVAKARSGEAAGRAAGIAHQVHGAMGFTQEHTLHHLTRRLWSWRDEYGNERVWQTRLGTALLTHAPENLWPALTTIGRPAA